MRFTAYVAVCSLFLLLGNWSLFADKLNVGSPNEGNPNEDAISGDWNGNGVAFDEQDHKFFRYIFHSGGVNPDIDRDGRVTQKDLTQWQEELKGNVPD